MSQTPWRIVGEEVATCNCAWGCPCQFNALPTHGRCEAVVAVRIREGHYAPIQFESDRERRKAQLNVPGVAKFRAEPIKNPVTGEEHRARIDNSYAQFASIDWSNA